MVKNSKNRKKNIELFYYGTILNGLESYHASGIFIAESADNISQIYELLSESVLKSFVAKHYKDKDNVKFIIKNIVFYKG